MKLSIVLLAVIYFSGPASADNAKTSKRVPSSTNLSSLNGASWTCLDPSNGHQMSAFYVRKDGTAKTVKILSVKEDANNSECYDVTFTWLDSNAKLTDAECCPTGMN